MHADRSRLAATTHLPATPTTPRVFLQRLLKSTDFRQARRFAARARARSSLVCLEVNRAPVNGCEVLAPMPLNDR